MHVEVRRAGDVVIVDLKGKLTAGLGDQILRDTLDELLAESWKKILLNLSEVSFLDSAGLGELVAGLKTARNLGADLKVLKASERVQHHALARPPAARVRGVRGRGGSRPPFRRRLAAQVSARATMIGSAVTIFSSIEHSGQLMLSPTSSS